MAAPSSTPRSRTAARRTTSGDISPARTPQGLALQVAQQATEASQIAQVEALRDIVTQTPPATLAHALESVLKGASPDDAEVLRAALKGMLGHKAYMSYPWDALFKPLGIHNATWETDADETFVASSYAYLTARDLARVGLLMARDGRWGDEQLLPKDWVAFNRQPFDKYTAGQDEAVPGGQWWLNQGAPRPWPDAPVDTFAALGHWGQALYVMPDEHLVIVRYGDDRDGSYRHNELLKRAMAAFAGTVQP